jgi:hypothetical protein
MYEYILRIYENRRPNRKEGEVDKTHDKKKKFQLKPEQVRHPNPSKETRKTARRCITIC